MNKLFFATPQNVQTFATGSDVEVAADQEVNATDVSGKLQKPSAEMLPQTGESDAYDKALLALLTLGAGATMVLSTRRRKEQN